MCRTPQAVTLIVLIYLDKKVIYGSILNILYILLPIANTNFFKKIQLSPKQLDQA